MGAVLRAYGLEFDPDRFCSESLLKPCALFRRGEPVNSTKLEGRKREGSGINIVVSEADFHELPQQIDEATAFLVTHKEELSRLSRFPGIDSMTIDFGIARRDVILQCDFLPPSLIRIASELGLGIELSHYPVEDEAPE